MCIRDRFNTNDHGLVLVHTKSDEKKETKKEETNDEGPWDHPTWIMVSSGFGM